MLATAPRCPAAALSPPSLTRLLQSKFTCTFLLPSFFASAATELTSHKHVTRRSSPAGGGAGNGIAVRKFGVPARLPLQNPPADGIRIRAIPFSRFAAVTAIPNRPARTIYGDYWRRGTNPIPLFNTHFYSTAPPTNVAASNDAASAEFDKHFGEFPNYSRISNYEFCHETLLRLPPHGDTFTVIEFQEIMSLPKPTSKESWLSYFFTGPWFPDQLIKHGIPRGHKLWHENNAILYRRIRYESASTKLLLFLEAAKADGYDLITELLLQGEWRKAVRIVRILLEPGVEAGMPEKWMDLLEGVRYTPLDGLGGRLDAPEAPSHVSAASAGTSGLNRIRNLEVKQDVERRRRGLGVVLGSLGEIFAVEKDEYYRTKDASAAADISRAEEKEIPYTSILPTARQILGYLHTTNLIPTTLYSPTRYPRLHVLKPRILASLADAVWRAQEGVTAEEAEANGIVGEYKGMEVPRARTRMQVWGSGSKDIETSTPSPSSQSPDQLAKVQWGAYTEREVFLELVLAIANELGYGKITIDILSHLSSSGKWDFVDYRSIYPQEYSPEHVNATFIEPKSGTAEQWAVQGYSLIKPPITTLPKSLPKEVVIGAVNAAVNTLLEGRGIRSLLLAISSLLDNPHLASYLPPETIHRATSHYQVLVKPEHDVIELVATIEKKMDSEMDMWYRTLDWHIKYNNIVGVRRVWKEMGGASMSHPEWVVGSYMLALIKGNEVKPAKDLITPVDGQPPVIPERLYGHPSVAPAVLRLATVFKDWELVRKVERKIAECQRNGQEVEHSTLTSLLRCYLLFGEMDKAHRLISTMVELGFIPDGVDIAIMIEAELRRDPDAGYKLAELASKTVPDSLGTEEKTTIFEEAMGEGMLSDQAKQILPEPPQQQEGEVARPPLSVSKDAWLSVLNTAVHKTNPIRAKWALDHLGVNLETGYGITTFIFNILLRGAVNRQGAHRGMELYKMYCTSIRLPTPTSLNRPPLAELKQDEKPPPNVVPDLLSMKTILHKAIRERVLLGVEGKWYGDMEESATKTKETLAWCWEEMRQLGLSSAEAQRIMNYRIKTGLITGLEKELDERGVWKRVYFGEEKKTEGRAFMKFEFPRNEEENGGSVSSSPRGRKFEFKQKPVGLRGKVGSKFLRIKLLGPDGKIRPEMDTENLGDGKSFRRVTLTGDSRSRADDDEKGHRKNLKSFRRVKLTGDSRSKGDGEAEKGKEKEMEREKEEKRKRMVKEKGQEKGKKKEMEKGQEKGKKKEKERTRGIKKGKKKRNEKGKEKGKGNAKAKANEKANENGKGNMKGEGK